MHKLASSIPTTNAARRRARTQPSAATVPAFRRAELMDVLQLCSLVNTYATQKLLLPRTVGQIALELDNYVVATDAGGRLLACAAVYEYSPSLAEIASVAVLPSALGKGLGSRAVLAAEQVARARGFRQVFAMSLADRFFLSLGYEVTSVDGFPEKVTRYQQIAAEGVEIVPKRCFGKTLGL
jgi:amino-acid N-acetyltransferase